jgi:hypothetical protein
MSSVQGANGASSAIQQWQYLQSLASTGSANQPSTGSNPTATAFDPFAGLGSDPTQSSGGSGGPTQPFSLEAMSALIDAQAQASGTNGMSAHQQKVFGKLDADGDGSVSQSEIENAFGADNKQLADAVFAKLDKNGDGAVSASEFAAGTMRGARHHKRAESADGQGGQDQLTQLLQAAGASSTSTSNSDGSSTTTITYADGSKVSMTTAASSNTDNSTNSGTSNSAQSNLLEQLIKLQAQLTSSATATSSTTA